MISYLESHFKVAAVNFLFAIAFGAATAIGATLIHQTLPPLGLIVGLIATYLAIWWIGTYYGRRRYRFFSLSAWIVVIGRAGSFGEGQELLIQGDNVGTVLLGLGFLAGFAAIFRKV